MSQQDFAGAGRWLLGEHRAGNRFVPFARERGVATVDDAYRIQSAYVSEMMAQDKAGIAGYKIGLTAVHMQKLCGIDVPVAGTVLDTRVHASGASRKLDGFGHLIIEFETCLRLGKDLPPREQAYGMEEVAAAVDGVAAAIELVDDRNCDVATLEALSLIADNAWNGAVVIGPFTPAGMDLAACEGIALADGKEIARAFGRDVLGGPMNPMLWLANHLRQGERGLKAGDIVMTGSMTAPQMPAGTVSYEFSLSGVGSVSAVIEG
jgi:2-keto-4-pentenoate hydratase